VQNVATPPMPPPKRAGFDTQLRKEGVRVELRRMDAPATVNVSHRGKTFAFLVEAMAALLAFAGAIALLRRERGAKWAYFIFVGLGALVVSGTVNPRSAGPWQMASIGVFAAVGIWLICGIRGWLAACMERRRERQVQAAKLAAEEAEKRAERFAARQAAQETKPTEPPAQP
jgi:heme A synthase